jgi:dTMP kinase
MRGKLVVFEGLDRSGKSTQSKLLHENLENSVLVRFPNRETTTGKIIDTYLKGTQDLCDEAIHLLFSANRWELKYPFTTF